MFMVNVGKYTSPMDPMGTARIVDNSHLILRRLWVKLGHFRHDPSQGGVLPSLIPGSSAESLKIKIMKIIVIRYYCIYLYPILIVE